MSDKSIKFFASKGKEEPWRYVRLGRLSQWLDSSWAEVSPNISELSDHKGDLLVRWKSAPTRAQKQIIKKGGEAQGDYHVRHIVTPE